MAEDEIVAEVRRVRADIFAKCGGTLDGLLAHLRALERSERGRQVVTLTPRRRRRRVVVRAGR